MTTTTATDPKPWTQNPIVGFVDLHRHRGHYVTIPVGGRRLTGRLIAAGQHHPGPGEPIQYVISIQDPDPRIRHTITLTATEVQHLRVEAFPVTCICGQPLVGRTWVTGTGPKYRWAHLLATPAADLDAAALCDPRRGPAAGTATPR